MPAEVQFAHQNPGKYGKSWENGKWKGGKISTFRNREIKMQWKYNVLQYTQYTRKVLQLENIST